MHTPERLGTLALVLSLLSCGDSVETGVSQSSYSALTRTVSAGPCFEGQCYYSVGVEAPGTLVLSDAEGELRLTIAAEAVNRVLRLLEGAEFAENTQQALCGAWDSDVRYITTRGERTDALRCDAFDTEKWLEVSRELNALWRETLECTAWEEPPGYSLKTDPLPARPLCFFCGDDCKPDAGDL